MKKDIVLHSDCPFLLMRMFTDLQMDGRFDDLWWNEYMAFFGVEYLTIYIDKSLRFYSHSCKPFTLIPLTESNYLSTLKMILE